MGLQKKLKKPFKKIKGKLNDATSDALRLPTYEESYEQAVELKKKAMKDDPSAAYLGVIDFM